MKKTRMGRTVWAVALIICFIALFTTCKNNIGLGGTVDINPPTLDVSTIYPPAGAVIRDDFILSIEAKDDSGIASVNVSVINTAPTEQPDGKAGLFELKKASDGLHWTAQVNKKDDEKGFPLKDGTYKVQLIATDTVGKTVRTESTLTIDNTAPLLVLNRPSTTTKDSSVDVFGDGFLLVGQVYDDTPVAALTVTAKGKGESARIFRKEVKNVPQNIRITVDAFSSDKKQEFYQALYGTKRDAGAKDYEYGITVTDDAKIYQAPGDNGTGTGNTTDRYYLFDDLYSDVLSEYRIQTVYNMMRGTYRSQSESGTTRSAAEIEADKKKMEDVQAALKKAQLGGDAERKGTFALNPSLNPTFAIAGETPIARPESGEPKFSSLYSGSTLTVKVSCNLDGIPLEGADSYRFFLMEWQNFSDFAGKLAYPTAKINSDDIYADADKTTFKPEFIELKKNPKVDKEGSNYIFTLPVSTDKTALSYGKSYVLLVRGKDKGEKNKPGNELIPDSKGVLGGVYGFTLRKTGKVPEVYVIKINQTVGQSPDSPITERVYLKKGEPLNFKMKLQQTAAKVTYTLRGAVGGDISKTEPYAVGEYDVTIEAAKFKQDADGTYKLTVKAEADEGTSLEQTYTIIYDVNGPEVKIAYPVGNLNGNEGNGLVIQGTAFDTGAGLADTNPVTVTLTKEDGSIVPVTFAADKKRENWELKRINLLEGKYTLKVTAKDKLGQSAEEKALVFTYDKAAPVITDLKVGAQTVKDGVPVYTNTPSITVSGTVTESYGIETFKIGETDAGTSPGPFNQTITLADTEGEKTVTITLKDKAGKDGSPQPIKVLFDKTAPVFENIKFANVDASGTLITTSENPVKITGTIKDAVHGITVSGIKEVYYAVTAAAASAPVDTSADWKQLNGTFSDNDYELDGFIEKLSLNVEQKIHIRAVDNAGNKKTLEQKVKVVPSAVVRLSLELLSGATTADMVKKNAGELYAKGLFKVKIGGQANTVPDDTVITGKLKNVKTSIETDAKDIFAGWTTGHEPRISTAGTPEEYTLASELDDGKYSITIRASNGQDLSLDFTVDKTVPTIIPAASGNGALPADNKWVNTKALYVEGTATDATSGIEKIEASVNGTEKLLGTDASWSGYLTLNEGNNTVQFKVTDKAGNTASDPTTPRTIKVDTGRPTIKLTSPADGPALVNSTSTSCWVTVTVSDTGGSDIAKVEYAKTVDFDSPQSATPSGDSATINLTGITADTTYYFRAVDNAGNRSDSVRVIIQKDSTPPEVSFVSHQENDKVNKKILIKGSASDNRELKSVKIVKVVGSTESDLAGVSASSGYDSSDAETAATKALFKGTKAYNWHFTLDTNNSAYPDNTDLKLKAIATDAAGNIKEEILTLNVDQNSDRPQIVITNLNDLTEASGILKQSKEIRGFIKDDDGEISQIKITEAGEEESTVDVVGSSWSYELKGADGIKTLNFEVTDKGGETFKTVEAGMLKQPRIYAGSISGSGYGTAVKFKMDTTAPISDGLSITDSSDGHEKAVERSLFLQTDQNGTYANAKFIVKAKDANNISKVKINIKQEGAVKDSVPAVIHDPINPSSNAVETWKTAGKNLKDLNLKDGTVEFEIELTDKSGLKSVTSYTAFIDNTAPDLKVLSPSSAGNISGDVTMTGSITDGGSGVTGLKYIKGKQASEPTLSSVWTDVEASSGTWKIDFSGANSITSSHNINQLGDMLPESGGKLYKVPVYFLMLDKVNNSHIIKKEFKVDPNGDIPEVTILSPADDVVLGGTIRIAGTVSVPKPEIGKVGSMYIQITNKTAGNPAKPDFSGSVVFDGEDWCPSGGKPLTYIEGSPYWSLQINEHHEFESATSDDQVIWFRLCGKNNKFPAVAGQWTDPVKITVNKKAPTITGVKVSTQAKIDTPLPAGSTINPDNRAYVSNMWIKGDDLYLCADLAHTAGIEKIDISGSYVGSSTITLTGDSEITGSNINRSGKAWFKQSGAASSTGAKNYKMHIPLKTTANPGSNNSFTIKVVITAKKEGNAEGLTAQSSWELKYDNTVPTAIFGTKIASSGTVQVSGSSFTDPALIGKTNINTSMKVFASGEAIKITNFDKDTGKITLASKPAHPTKGYLIYAPIEYLRPTSSTVGVFGAAYDVGAGVEKIKVKYTVKNKETPEETLEFPIGIQKDVGSGDVNFVTWSGELNTSALIDGKGTLTITPIDAAGNAPSPIAVEVKHKKNSLTITKVFLGTDLNRNGSIEESTATQMLETATLTIGYEPLHPDGIDSTRRYDWYGKSDGGTFRFKNDKSYIKIETVGGSGTNKYTLKCTTTGDDIRSLTELPAGGIIELTADDFTKIGQSTNFDADPTKRTLVLTVWDSAHDLTCGTDTWKAELTLDVIVDTNDRIVPTNTIDPFKWTSESENSLYGNSRDNGHIEIGTDLPSAFTDGGTGVMDRDDKVSGKISITGTVNDDQVITEILAKIDGFKFDGITGAAESAKMKLTEYDPTTGKFKDVGAGSDVYDPNYRPSVPKPESTAPGEEQNAYNEYTAYITKRNNFFAAKGWLLTIVNSEFSVEKGHTVKWRLDWDSSKINGGVGTDKTITITVKDTAQTNTVSDNRKVDVVPYISGLTTSLSKLGGNAPDLYARTALGRYPVEDGETIKVHGFNLTGAACTVGGVSCGTLSADGSSWKLTLSADAKSGKLVATVNSIAAINNTNNNDKPYNKGSKTANNDKLTDDVELDVWQFGSKAAQPVRGIITEPVMRINPSNGIIGFAFANGPDYFSMSNGTSNSYTKWHQNYDDFGNVDFVYDRAGTAHGVVAGRDINSSEQHAGKFTYVTSKWGPASSLGDGNNYDGTNALRLEALGQLGDINFQPENKWDSDKKYAILDKTRIQHPSLAAAGAGNPRIYLAYYDSLNDQIRFKAGTLISRSKANFDQFTDQEDSSRVKAYSQSNVSIVAGKYKSGSSKPNTGNTTGTYLSLGVVSGTDAASDVAVLIWFDETNQKLKYTYKKKPQTPHHAGETGVKAGEEWTTPKDVFSESNIGEYCKIAVDKAGGIHIAAFDADAADLKYAYLSEYDAASFHTATVDSYGITGTYISLDVAYTENGTNGKPVPYIGYYSASARCSKLAYLDDTATGVSGSAQGTDDSGYFTGKWEVSVVPTASRVQQDNINVGVWKDASGVIKASATGTSKSETGDGTVYGNGTANPVLGYAIKQSMNGYIETAQKK